ncbi:MAG: serine/threonine protein kinase, partial [Clostridiales bacterium]|nr:serine/threonine protein kinase [Clostridiales bacterium]
MNSTTPVLSDPTYRIESELGSGGGGVVYKAWHTRLQKHVVIKELKSGSQHDIETQRNEVEALKNVKSAYLPQVFDFLTEGNRIYTVMEFIRGESLDKFLERGQKFSQTQVVKWYGQLVSALEAIHGQGVCHRDIKPANIMLMPDGDVCLIDFNAALVSGNDVRMISRSLGYASPEQYEIYEHFRRTRSASPINLSMGTETELLDDDKTEFISENAADDNTEYISPPKAFGLDWKRSDIYSLGATMYHLVSGKYPSERAAEVV